MQRHLFLAELFHERGFLLDQDQFPLVDYADAVGHFLGFIDVVRGQDDGHAAVAQRPDQPPHVAAQFHIHARGRFVEEQDLRLVRQGLGDQHAALHAARQRHDLVVALVPQRQVAQHLPEMRRVARAAEQPPAEAHRVPHGLERVGVQLLRHQADLRPRCAVIAHDVVAVGEHRSRGRRDDPADDADQRRLSRAVGPEQGEDLALADFEVDALQCLQARSVGLGQVGNGDDRLHRCECNVIPAV